MNDTSIVIAKHPSGLRRIILEVSRTATCEEFLQALIRRHFVPRESPTRRYVLIRSCGRRLLARDVFGAVGIGERELLQITVDRSRGR